jgi:hypothetical protein
MLLSTLVMQVGLLLDDVQWLFHSQYHILPLKDAPLPAIIKSLNHAGLYIISLN